MNKSFKNNFEKVKTCIFSDVGVTLLLTTFSHSSSVCPSYYSCSLGSSRRHTYVYILDVLKTNIINILLRNHF